MREITQKEKKAALKEPPSSATRYRLFFLTFASQGTRPRAGADERQAHHDQREVILKPVVHQAETVLSVDKNDGPYHDNDDIARGGLY